MGRRRGTLVAALALTVLAGSGTWGYVATREDEAPTAAAPASAPQDRPGLLERVGDAALDLVGADRGTAKAEPVSSGLSVDQPPVSGRAWPAQKRVREVASKRTANARVYQLADGRLQAEISSVPVNYRDGKGRFQPIDTRVRPTGRSGYVQGNSTNTFASLFGDSSDDLVRFEKDGRSVELGLPGADRDTKPVVSGSTVTYPGLADGADLVYEVSSTELKEKILLKRAPSGPVSYTFSLDLNGLSAAPQPDGSIDFVTAAGATALTMPAPYMYDETGATSTKVTQKVTGDTVTVTADTAWLTEPGRAYPVVVDPTIRVQPVPTDAQDVMISSGATTTNYDSSYELRVGTDTSAAWRSLLKFDTGMVPAGTAIDDAQLQLYYDSSYYAYGFDVPMEARRITTPWSETTATWASTNANVTAEPVGNIVTVDDGDTNTSAVGTWTSSTNATLTAKAIGGDYRVNNDTTAGHTHTWVPTITEAGNYLVEVHYVGESDRASNAPYTVYYNGGSKAYTVDQTTPVAAGGWKTLGVHPFAAGTTGKVVLGDVAGKAVIADAVRFTKANTVKANSKSSVWSSFPVRNVVQEWVNGTAANNGLMIKAVNETDKGRGGAIFQASEYAYNNERRDANLPKLTITYGRPGVAVNPPTTITSTGALLDWPAYTGTDIAEYQVHRSVYQTWTPSAATLVAPVDKGTTSFQDSTASPTPAAETDIMKRKFFYYMVAVKTTDGKIIAGPTAPAMLPRAGQITKIFRTGVTDTTLSAGQPAANVNSYAGDPYVSPGNNSSVYGDTRALVRVPVAGVPATAQLVDARLRMWNVGLYPGTDTDENIDAHPLTRAFDQAKATWNTSDGTTVWTTPGGDYAATALAADNTSTNDPKWLTWDVTAAAKGWITNPATNHGLLLRQRDEVNQTARAMLLSAEAAEPLLRPTLEVTYLEKTPESTYYVPELPEGAPPAGTFTTPVSISNPTGAAWKATDWQLSYRWTRADGAAVTGAQAVTALPADVPSGGTADLTATVTTPPSTTEGNKKTDYTINWELRNRTTGQTLQQAAAIAPLAQNIAVVEPTSDQLGLEKFYSYAGKNTGGGGTLMNNLYAGNTVWSYNAFSNPSRGLVSFVRLAYNSLDTSDTVAGYGWSLQASSMMRLGSPLDFHPNPKPTSVTFTDGDGTSHWFTLDAATNTWTSPKGVHLYLQKKAGVDCRPNTQEPQAWSLTRPDRTQFFYDCEGYLTSTVDKNGNAMTFTYEERKSNNKPTKFLRYVTDPENRQTITLDYYAKGDAYDYIDDTTWTRSSATGLTNPKIIDHVRSITDVGGRRMTFTYTDKGLLGELVDGAGSASGSPKTFKFAYDMTQGNKNVKLVKVTDPRGNSTGLAYHSPSAGDDPQWHWRTKSYTDRLGALSRFAYTDPDGSQGGNIDTVVTDAEGHTAAYRMDGYGRPYQTTNAKAEVTKLTWDDQHNVSRLEEANGAASTWTYDARTGYPTEIRDQQAVKDGYPGTVLTYQTQLGGYVADITTKTSPEGRKWSFGYTSEGDLATVTDPLGTATTTTGDYTTTNTYDTWGRLITSTDANGNSTTYGDYDANGYPKVIADALDNVTSYVYDDRGRVTRVTDALGKALTQTYDTFGRPLVHRQPKDQAAGVYVTTPAPVYDANDNVTTSTAPNGAVTTAEYDPADQLVTTTAPADTSGGPQRRTTHTYDKVGNLLTTTEPNGNLTATAGDYTTTNTYDAIYQLTTVTNAVGQKIQYEYDTVGNVVTMRDPRKNATADTADYTTGMVYDLAHRVVRTTDAAGKSTRGAYDKDGLVTSATDQLGNTTLIGYDGRGKMVERTVPRSAGVATVFRYEYDQVGNQTKMISPRGVATTGDADDFATVQVYDKLNRLIETHHPYAKSDPRYNTPDKTTYAYDKAGRLVTSSAPPSAGQSVRNDTTYTYFDNGWTKSSSDPWDIVTTYDYNEIGGQTARTATSAGGSSNRTMSWSYYPDGKLKSRADDGVPVGRQVVLVDNSDFNNTSATGTWPVSADATGRYGTDHATHTAGTGDSAFTWRLNVPQSGSYQVFARFPQVSGAATNAEYTVAHSGGDTVRTVDQSVGTGTWVSLGSYAFAEGNTHRISLSDKAGGTVVADAVKIVRDNAADVDDEKKDYGYQYDANGNLTTIADASPGARVDRYAVTYTQLNQVAEVNESKSGSTVNSTSFTYNENGAPLTLRHDKQYSSYEYETRDLVAKVTNGKSATDTSAKATTYTYTDRGEKLREVKGNGNAVDYTYFLDGLLKSQTEKKPDGTLVAENALDYDVSGNRSHEVARKMNADDHGAYLTTTSDYTYDPRDRLAQVTRTGTGAGGETYEHDANGNVTRQSVKGVTTTFRYDRDRLLTASAGGADASYNYDPFGRLDTVTSAGLVVERNVYDGFDHVVENRRNNGVTTTTTEFTYDPMDRTATRTADAGSAEEKTTVFNYLGLSSDVMDEEVAGKLTKSYQYSPWGRRLSQITHAGDGSTEQAYYGYNPHTDVETLTDASGDTKATYGYTAYGSNDDSQFTGIDKPDTTDPLKEPYNSYRFNSKRWDQASGSYDMGFRDYSPGLNRFLTRDSYNGALADLNLGINPWTGNRYAFGGGNPVTAVEIDGHCWEWAQGICDTAGDVANWVDHNSDTLQDLAVDAAETVLGAAATVGGGAMMATGVAACGVSVPFAVTGVGAVVTAAGCAGGAALAGGGVLVSGLGIMAMVDGASKFGEDLNRLENPPGDGTPAAAPSGPSVNKTNGLADGDKDLRRTWKSGDVNYNINTGHGFNRAHGGGTDLRTTGLTPDEVEKAIIADIEKFKGGGGKLADPADGTGVFKTERTIDVNGNSITYRANQTTPDTVNVATYWLN
ncbi:DNRLRE domain-containing protein [Actinoplanes solisilvae]|uniref:golvesin C-terminal-like domain-containing protein n=1 Tax=Actinoplanes solisilvae TaxID=2486853 RepID=UPI000FD78EB3|nr:DNRLRE domain-containing protein [Actinoplanes solisilvae]